MSETRVRVADTGTFTPREWLRREVLWASLMIPYTEQYAGWFNEKELYHHKGNSSRQAL
ncbi:MAG TPA: hypothetical protein VN778_05545 [Verrucomicrobiae bacterium]|nr:hypothetical protein [Verrucomicrobiae bacterium]